MNNNQLDRMQYKGLTMKMRLSPNKPRGIHFLTITKSDTGYHGSPE